MNFIEHVVAEKHREIATAKSAHPAAYLLASAHRKPSRDFHAAVSRQGAIIAELKARTPTISSFRHSDSLAELAGIYARNGAAAISIVADPARFGTSLADVTSVRETVTLPILAKDFVIDAYQVIAARAAGADAILLMVRLLDREHLHTLIELSTQLGMSALVETHSEAEIRTAVDAGARIIGINNRDFDTMTVSLDTTRRLAGFVPANTILISESGIASRADIEDLAARGARAFLVGGSLLGAADPGATLRELAASPLRPDNAHASRVEP